MLESTPAGRFITDEPIWSEVYWLPPTGCQTRLDTKNGHHHNVRLIIIIKVQSALDAWFSIYSCEMHLQPQPVRRWWCGRHHYRETPTSLVRFASRCAPPSCIIFTDPGGQKKQKELCLELPRTSPRTRVQTSLTCFAMALPITQRCKMSRLTS